MTTAAAIAPPDNDARHGVGGNRPPIPQVAAASGIQIDLGSRYESLLDRCAELTASAAKVPERIEDDDICGKVQELVRAMRSLSASAEAARKEEKAPYSDGADAVDGFFHKRLLLPIGEKQKGWRDRLLARVGDYLRRKEDAERLRREEEARKQREESERQAALAQEAQRQREQAEQRRRDEEAAAERARQEKERQLAEARAAEERAARAKIEAAAAEKRTAELKRQREEQDRLDAERRKQREAEQQQAWDRAESRRRQEQREREDREAAKRQAEIAAEQQAEQARLDAARKQRLEEEAKALAAREQAAAEDRRRLDADAAAKEQTAIAKTAGKAERLAEKTFERAESQAARHEKAAGSRGADLARTRSDLGTVGTLAQSVKFRIDDASKIPLERLRGYITHEQLEVIVGKYVREHGRDAVKLGVQLLPGVTVYLEEGARVI